MLSGTEKSEMQLQPESSEVLLEAQGEESTQPKLIRENEEEMPPPPHTRMRRAERRQVEDGKATHEVLVSPLLQSCTGKCI